MLPPKHNTFLTTVDVLTADAGCDITTVFVTDKPQLFVTAHEYVPAPKPVAVAALPPLGLHVYVKLEPPVAVAVAVPEEPPLHKTLVLDIDNVGVGQVTTIGAVNLALNKSANAAEVMPG